MSSTEDSTEKDDNVPQESSSSNPRTRSACASCRTVEWWLRRRCSSCCRIRSEASSKLSTRRSRFPIRSRAALVAVAPLTLPFRSAVFSAPKLICRTPCISESYRVVRACSWWGEGVGGWVDREWVGAEITRRGVIDNGGARTEG